MSRTCLCLRTCSLMLFIMANNLYGQYGGGMSLPSLPSQSATTPAAPQAPKQAPSYVIPVPSKTRTPAKHPSTSVAPASAAVQAPFPQVEAGPVRNDSQAILEVIENQLSAVQTKDYKKAYLDYTSEALRNRTPMETFVYYVNHYTVLGHNKNAMFGNPEFKGNTAILRGTLTSTDGSSYKAEYHLIREGNDWKVNGLQLIPITPAITAPRPTQAGANYNFQKDIH